MVAKIPSLIDRPLEERVFGLCLQKLQSGLSRNKSIKQFPNNFPILVVTEDFLLDDEIKTNCSSSIMK